MVEPEWPEPVEPVEPEGPGRVARFLLQYWWVALIVVALGLVIATPVLIATGVGEEQTNVQVDTESLESQVSNNTQAIKDLGGVVTELSGTVGDLSSKMAEGFGQIAEAQRELPKQFAEELRKGVPATSATSTTGAEKEALEGFMEIPSKKVLWCPDNGEAASSQKEEGGIEIEPLKFRWMEVAVDNTACPE